MAWIKFILLVFLIQTLVYGQNKETPQQLEARCDKEIKEKCDPNAPTYDCIVDGMSSADLKFSKECGNIFVQQIREGKYPIPCLEEIKALCPNDANGECLRARRNSLSPSCSETLGEDGMPKIENEEELKVVQKACETAIEVFCSRTMIMAEMAVKEEKIEEATELYQGYIKCVERTMKNNKDQKCQAAMKDFIEGLK